MKNRQTFTAIFYSLILLCSSAPAWSARAYDIELVIFKYSGTEQYNTERWSSSWKIPDIQESLDLKKIPWNQKEQFQRLSSNQRILDQVVSTLKKSERYEVLAHLAWRQPGLGKDDAVNIKIEAGQAYRQITPQHTAGIGDGETSTIRTGSLFISKERQVADLMDTVADPNRPVTVKYETLSNEALKTAENPVYELSGNFKVVISRFIHVYADLLLMEPVTLRVEQATETSDSYTNTDSETLTETPKYEMIISKPGLSFTTLHGFNIQEHRRMRSNELHFIDHPLLGVIVQAWHAKDEKQ